MIQVGLDIQSSITHPTGVGIYTKNLFQILQKISHPEFNIHGLAPLKTGHLNTPKRLWWENVELPRLASNLAVDVLHVPAFSPPVKRGKYKVIVTVHDLIGMMFPNQKGLFSKFYWGTWLPWAIKHADCWIADSRHTKVDILHLLKLPEKKISVVYPSGHENFSPRISKEVIQKTLSKFKIYSPYFLYVGTIEPRKNLKNSILAFDLAKKMNPSLKNHQFVVVGSKKFAHGTFFESLKKDLQYGFSEIIFTDYINHDELNAIYCGSTAFIFASLYEGFGIPILEAMACHTPVIASNKTSIPEVAGNAAMYVNPEDTKAIANAMIELATQKDVRELYSKLGAAQVSNFSWEITARKVLGIYQSVL